MISKKGLGKGLGALIPDFINDEEGQMYDLNIDEILPAKNQVRKNFEEKKLKELAESIRDHGMLQPIIVRKVEKGYEVIAGERRWRACKMAGLKNVKVIIKNVSDIEAAALSLIENIQRQELSPIEEAQAYHDLIKKYKITQEEISKKIGRSRPYITNMLRLLTLPEEIKKLVGDGKISSGHARAILMLESEEEKLKLADEIIKNELNVREAEKLAKKIDEGVKKIEKIKDEYYNDLEERLKNFLKAEVKIKVSMSGKGRIEIQFFDQEQLKKILQMFHVLHDGETTF